MRRRVIVSLGLLLALFVIGSVTAIVSLDRTTKQLAALAESHRIQSLREHLIAAGLRVETDLLAEFAGHRPHGEVPLRNQKQLATSLDRCGRCHHQANIQEKLDEIRASFSAFQAVMSRLPEAGIADQDEASKQRAFGAADRLVDQTTALAELAEYHLTIRDANAAIGVRKAQIVLFATLAASLVLGGFVALHLKKRITKPLQALLDNIERVRQGDMTGKFIVQGDEEFQTLASAFNQAYAELKSAHNSVLHAEQLATAGRMSAGIAHEVLNPLASISSVVQVMQGRTQSAEQKEQLGLILTEVSRITNVLRDLQTLAKPFKDQSPRAVNIEELLDYAFSLVGYDRRAGQVSINNEVGQGLSPVLGDTDRLLLVFMNLMINALDAINAERESGGTLTISARNMADRVQITIRDNGVGMSEDQLERAFDPFFTTKAPGAGTGLGLWICKQVIQGHGGTIRLHSPIGQGTTVTVSLPCEPGAVGLMAASAGAACVGP